LSHSSDEGTAEDITGDRTRQAEPPSSAEPSERGRRLGRYTILEREGAGATGVVYSAYDPELDRRVALKVIGRTHRRSRREALAMAKLAHANVVTIYDVGEHEGRLFLAMEFADGGTVADWLAERRPWREVLDVFTRAGRGLEAVHRAGLVHRDFKPANILLFESGDVRVSDFGLARAVDGDVRESGEVAPSPPPPETGLDETVAPPALTPSSSLRDRVTRPGDLLGTPLFMSPEQHRGEAATALSDQFAFAVALFEALTGDVPFAGHTRGELLAALEKQTPTFPPRSQVPGQVRRALVRALSFRPEDRFPDMPALLAALAPPRRWLGLGLAAGLAVAVATGLLMSGRTAAVVDPCATPAITPDDVWNEAGAREVRAALLATKVPFAASAADAVAQRLDAWAAQLRSVEHELCVQRGPAYEAQVACLADSKAEVAALRGVLAKADALAAGRAVQAAQTVAPPHACTVARAERPVRMAELTTLARRTLASARVLVNAGRHPDAAALARVAVTLASAAGDERTAVRATLTLARLEGRVDPKKTLPLLEEALWRALASGDDGTSIAVLVSLVSVCTRANEPALGHRYARRAHDLLARSPDELQRADLLSHEAALLRSEERAAEALPLIEEALAIRVRLLPATSLDVASSYTDLGNNHFRFTRFPEARAAYRRSLEIRLAALGPFHPHLGGNYSNLGAAAYGLGEYQAAAEQHQHALEIHLRNLPPDALELAITHYNLAGAYFALGRYGESLAEYELSRAIYVKRSGPDAADVADIVADVADVHAAEKRWDQALAGYAEALVRARKLGDEDGMRAATIRSRRGRTLLSMGRWAEARVDAQAAARGVEKVYGPEHIELATALQIQGEAELRLGQKTQAAHSLERALVIRETLAGSPDDLAAVKRLLDEARR
jgi:tetratricopeptide (TPR) repeat protein